MVSFNRIGKNIKYIDTETIPRKEIKNKSLSRIITRLKDLDKKRIPIKGIIIKDSNIVFKKSYDNILMIA